jgi:hypothetical protein
VVLGAIGTGLLSGVAGCNAISGRTVTLEPVERVPTTGVTAGEALIYRAQETDIATVRLDQVRTREKPTGDFPIDVALEHPRATTIESLRFDIRATPRGGTPAAVYLRAGQLEVTLDRIGNGWVRVTVPELGTAGQGDMSFPAVVAPIDPVNTVELRGQMTVTRAEAPSNRTYRIEPRIEIDCTTG